MAILPSVFRKNTKNSSAKCRDVACHVWVNITALPRNIQTWHATSLHFRLQQIWQVIANF
ncbi:MAG: hypothetical protein HDS84_02710 [Bacteroidales bacterium]|nr:hypothetical protein [Bacteroidales bacterium]